MTRLVFGATLRHPRVGVTMAVTVTTAMLLAGTTACGTGDASPSGGANSTASTTPATGTFSVQDPWVKAADAGMTAAFATLVNHGTSDVTVVSATSDASGVVELHETATQDGRMVMQQKRGGITVKAGSVHRLEPGGDHLMLMDLSRPIQAGEEVRFTLTLSDGRTVDFTAVAKPFTGAQESYHPDHAGHSGTGN